MSATAPSPVSKNHVYRAHVGRLCVLFPGAPFVIAILMLALMIFLCSFNYTIPPVDSGSGGSFSDYTAIESERFAAMNMLRYRSGSEALIYDRQSVDSGSLSIDFLYHLDGVFTPTTPGDHLLTAERTAAIAQFESRIREISGFSVQSPLPGETFAPSDEVRCLLRPIPGVTKPTRVLPTDESTACTENIFQLPTGFECVPPRSIVDITSTGDAFLPKSTAREAAAAGRSLFTFGLPLPCYPNANVDDEGEVDPGDQTSNFSDWFKDEMMPFIENEGADILSAVGVVGLPYGNAPIQYWFTKIIEGDLAFVAIAAVAVACMILFMSRSFMLTLCGICHVMLSYYSSWIFYVLFGFEVFPGLVQMVIFIILGIGADDIFVLLDAWKRSHHEVGSNINESVAIKMSVVLMRAARAMFVTTFTTFSAFVATAVSPVPAISAFGFYAASSVVLNYFFVITWFPAIMLIWHRWFEFRSFFPTLHAHTKCFALDVPPLLKYHPQWQASQDQAAAAAAAAAAAGGVDGERASTAEGPKKAGGPTTVVVAGASDTDVKAYSDAVSASEDEGDDLIPRNAPSEARKGVAMSVPKWICAMDKSIANLGPVGLHTAAALDEPLADEHMSIRELSMLERIFHHWLFPVVRLFRLPIIVFYAILFVITVYFALQLEPAGDNDLGLPDDEPISQVNTLLSDAFGSTDSFGQNSVCFVYGVDTDTPIDRAGTDPNAEDYVGDPIFNASFAYDPPTISAMAASCVRLIETAESFVVLQGGAVAPAGTAAAVDFEPASSINADLPCISLAFTHWLHSGGIVDPNAAMDWADIRSHATIPAAYDGFNVTAVAIELEAFFATTYGALFNTHAGFTRPTAVSGGVVPAPTKVHWVKTCFPAVTDPDVKPRGEFIDVWEAMAVKELNASNTVFFIASSAIVSSVSVDTMQTSTLVSAGISLLLVFVIMALFSGSVPIAFIVTICIVQILVFVFAYMQWRGWPLDFIESVALTVLVGISVDFTVHYGVAYQESVFTHRQRRLRFAITSMGTSITSGALTTLSSAFLLFFTTFTFFKKFGEFMFVTIALSWLVANTLFPAICFYIGPTGHFGDIHHYIGILIAKMRNKGSGVQVANSDQSPSPQTNVAGGGGAYPSNNNNDDLSVENV